MAGIRITIETDGTAFHVCEDELPDRARRMEVERILHVLANDFGDTGTCADPRDTNQNVVGTVEMLEDATLAATKGGEAFREIGNLAAEAHRSLQADEDPHYRHRIARGHLTAIQTAAQNGLREALQGIDADANDRRRLAAFDGLLGIANLAVLFWSVSASDMSLPIAERQGAREKASAAQAIIAKAKE